MSISPRITAKADLYSVEDFFNRLVFLGNNLSSSFFVLSSRRVNNTLNGCPAAVHIAELTMHVVIAAVLVGVTPIGLSLGGSLLQVVSQGVFYVSIYVFLLGLVAKSEATAAEVASKNNGAVLTANSVTLFMPLSF
ncbi:hypothetical protein DID80_03990 [Candidatus Marinamargulisbacteria bacterium SCGC AAA071-K20]|nr:hypothetical protein DID80_03990 [Candidatus Marinamargulisbacteria bacterium SCGC AAA071-K20]